MKKVELKGVVKVYNDGIGSSYTQLLNLITRADSIEYVKQRLEYLLEFSVVTEYFSILIESNKIVVSQIDSDDVFTKVLIVTFA